MSYARKDLNSAVALINVWNRFGVAYRWTPPARQVARAAR